jgi:hypothetical protein
VRLEEIKEIHEELEYDKEVRLEIELKRDEELEKVELDIENMLEVEEELEGRTHPGICFDTTFSPDWVPVLTISTI